MREITNSISEHGVPETEEPGQQKAAGDRETPYQRGREEREESKEEDEEVERESRRSINYPFFYW